MICRCFRSRGVDAVYNWKEVTDEDDRDIELRDDVTVFQSQCESAQTGSLVSAWYQWYQARCDN